MAKMLFSDKCVRTHTHTQTRAHMVLKQKADALLSADRSEVEVITQTNLGGGGDNTTNLGCGGHNTTNLGGGGPNTNQPPGNLMTQMEHE